MTENQNPTDLQERDSLENPADSATADALDSVTATERSAPATPADHAADPADESASADSADAASADEVDPTTADALESVATTEQVVSVATTEQVVDLTPGDDGDLEEDYLEPGQTEVPVGDEVVIDDETMRRAIEAILMVTDEPLPVLTLARTVGRPTADVSAALSELADEYTEQGRGFDLREVGGGWRYYTRAEAAQYVERFVLDGQQARLTQAALETLAVVAYKQPVSRARVSAIRGVNVDGVMRTLVSRGLVEEAGADTESQATLYRTTSYFLERMGMQSLDDLPELAPYLPEMDDMEEELAAQITITDPEPPADTDESAGLDVSAGTEQSADTEGTAGADLSAVIAGSAADTEPSATEPSSDRETATQDQAAEDSELDGGVDDSSGAGEGELEPAEELEAGGEGEIEQELDPAEVPEVADGEDADGNDVSDDDGNDDDRDEVGAVGGHGADDLGVGGHFSNEENSTGEGDVDAVGDSEDGLGGFDDSDEDDESADERLEAAEDLVAAENPDAAGGTSQYRSGSIDDD